VSAINLNPVIGGCNRNYLLRPGEMAATRETAYRRRAAARRAGLEFTWLRQQRLYAIRVFLRCMPHASSMTMAFPGRRSAVADSQLSPVARAATVLNDHLRAGAPSAEGAGLQIRPDPDPSSSPGTGSRLTAVSSCQARSREENHCRAARTELPSSAK
jgi:hypothetical protein